MTDAKLSSSWVVEDKKNNVYDKILYFMRKHRMVIIEKKPKKISAKHGSPIITRLLGTFLTPVTCLPKKTIIELEEVEKGTKIKAHIREDIGLGINTNLEYKYKNFFSVWLDDLKKHLIEP